jgi:hypothetical protein
MSGWLPLQARAANLSRELFLWSAQEGSGAIRDAFGDMLFPGTSTIMIRARCFLLIPWTYRPGDYVLATDCCLA